MQCAYHPDREPVGACVACGRLICVECKALLGGKIYCTPCADKIFVQKQADTSVKEPAPAQHTAPVQPAARTEPPPLPPTKSSLDESPKPASQLPAVPITTTDSGKGSLSVLPAELKGFNWGAFFLSWIWGIGNKVWISFIVLVLGIIWSIVLGLKGNEWAWQNKQWDSIEHFKKTQKMWRKWAIAVFIISIAISLVMIIISVALGMGGYKIKLG
jgi:hypothetical protein